MFENFRWNKVYKIREKLNMTKIQSQLIILRFQDMQDWQFLNQRKLKRKNIPFKLQDVMTDVNEIMTFQAESKRVKLVFTSYFRQQFIQ